MTDKTQAALDEFEQMLSFIALSHSYWGTCDKDFISDFAVNTIRAALTAQLTKTDDNVSCPSVANAGDINAELLEALKECLPRIEEIRLVDLGAVRAAEMQDYQERKILARRELAETNELINKINKAIQRAEAQKVCEQ